jgi:predicted DNA binding CopG/RHH family protein
MTTARDLSKVPPEDWTEEELDTLTDQAIAEGTFKPLGERALRTVRTIPISLRLPEPLLGQLKLEAVNRGMSYQRLLKQLVEEGLTRPATARQVHRPAARPRAKAS